MTTKSIYKHFFKKLIFATSFLLVSLAFIFYGFTKSTIYEDIKNEMIENAKVYYKTIRISTPFVFNPKESIDLIKIDNFDSISFRVYHIEDNYYAELLYPYDFKEHLFIKIKRNINDSIKLLNRIFNNILFLLASGIFLILLYALNISKNLLKPIINITNKLSHMDENYLEPIKKDSIPIEFYPLADSINNLTNRIKNHISYQKELFIGAAHELKTPLAVMKMKNEVTLIKPRDREKYIETIKLNIESINNMNKMISSILNMGRQEGAVFDKPAKIDIIKFLDKKIADYKILAESKKINLIYSAKGEFITTIQENLFEQILQNFIQNSIKFTPENKTIEIKVKLVNNNLEIKIFDEGPGIKEGVDLFAPFKRIGNKSGAGLGLFLAKNASKIIGADISLENRKDKQGAVATIILYDKPVCKL